MTCLMKYLVIPKIEKMNLSKDEEILLKRLLSFLSNNFIEAADRVEDISLKEFSEMYLTSISSACSAAYLKSHTISFNHLIGYFGQDKKLTEITSHEAENFVYDLQSKVKKGYRVYFRNIRSSFTKAVDWNYITENHFKKIKLPKMQQNKPQFLTRSEFNSVFVHLNQTVKEVSLFSFLTGLRAGELVNLNWENVNLQKRFITVGSDNFITKSRKQRTIPLCNEAHDILENRIPKVFHLNKNLYVFCKEDGTQFTTDYISKYFKKACRKAGIDERIKLHSLRASFASNLSEAGVPVVQIKELLGHSSINTTMFYATTNIESLRKAVNVLDNL